MTPQQEAHDLDALRYSLKTARLLRRIAEPIIIPLHRREIDRSTDHHIDEAAKAIRRLLVFKEPTSE